MRRSRSVGASLLLLLAACSFSDEEPPPPAQLPGCCTEPKPDVCFVHLEAEAFTGPWGAQRNIAAFYGQGFITSNARGVADTQMRAEVELCEGRYVVWTRGFRDVLAREWTVTVDGATVAATHTSFAGEAGFTWMRAGEIDVAEGTALIAIEDAGDSFEVVDAIALSTDLEFDPDVAEDEWRVLDRDFAADMMLDASVDRAERIRLSLPAPTTQNEWVARRDDIRAKVVNAMGMTDLPERTPLSPEIVDTIQHDGYRVELLRFESRPSMIVTAHLYVPDGNGPFPAVVHPIGHYYDFGKSDSHVAPRAHGLAKLGYVSLVYDAFGQGERDVGGQYHQEGWNLALTGRSNLTVMAWDSMRAIDYLETRSEVDASRVAITGASGGGLNSLYTSVIDDRITASIPVVYVSEFSRIFEAFAPHDACTYMWGMAGFTDMSEIASLFAPRPQLMMAGAFDTSFPADGTTRAHQHAAGIYDLYGAQDDVKVFVDDVGHDYSRGMREQLYGFVEQHLNGAGDGSPIPEPAFNAQNPADTTYQIYGGNRVPGGGATPRSLALTWAENAVATLPGPTAVPADLRDTLKATLLTNPHPMEAELVEVGTYRSPLGFDVQRLRFDLEPGVSIPAYYVEGPPDSPVVVVIDGAGIQPPEILRGTYQLGAAVLYVQPRGRGETARDEHVTTGSNFLLGDTLVALRANDLAKVRHALRSWQPTGGRPVGLLALGEEASLTALFTQALYPEFDAVALGPVMGTFLERFVRTVPLAARVFGVLLEADIPHMIWLAGEQPLYVNLASDYYASYHSAWPDALGDRVTFDVAPGRDDGIGWLISQMR